MGICISENLHLTVNIVIQPRLLCVLTSEAKLCGHQTPLVNSFALFLGKNWKEPKQIWPLKFCETTYIYVFPPIQVFRQKRLHVKHLCKNTTFFQP